MIGPNPQALANKQDWELFNIIRDGKDKMPPETDGRATDTEVWNLVIYIRGFSKGQSPAPPAHRSVVFCVDNSHQK